MDNFISIVNNFNLVIYCDENSVKYINTKNNPNIKVIIKPIEEFYNYKYKEYWIKNHNNNILLRDNIEWHVNMLWSEKVWFVNETIQNNYFDTELYGWCDIGYFRNDEKDIHTEFLSNWPNKVKLNELDTNKIYYACINNNNGQLKYLHKIIDNKNSIGLPIQPIPPHQQSIAGGFFILHKDKIQWWREIYDNTLSRYFRDNYLVKDDQIILVDCIFSNMEKFNLIEENDQKYNNWFLFQRFLL
jgi:hypothetical protein